MPHVVDREPGRESPQSLLDSAFFDPPLPLDDPLPERIGAYRIFGVVGYGGMGVVYEAEQEIPQRRVALKVVHPHLATRQYRRRFAQEIRTLGRLEHVGIARIYEGGSAPDDRGEVQLYLAMELVCGLRVDEHVRSHQLGPRAIAELMATICDAVQHAHQKGVIHCDLKPANILVAVGGVPKVLDFGVARIVGDDAIERTTALRAIDDAAVVGTLAFASPEQAAGDRNRIDAITDVYGLGAVLHAMLTAEPPHRLAGRCLADALATVRDGSPPGVRAIRPDIPRDLETIVGKALSIEPADRYDTAAALAADLRRFVGGRPIEARRASRREVVEKWVRRNRLAAASIGAACVAVVVGAMATGTLLVNTLQTMRERDAEAHRALASSQILNDTLASLQGAQLPPEARHQRSRVLVAGLRDEESADHPAQVLMLMPGSPRTLAGHSGHSGHPGHPGHGGSSSPFVALDAKGDVVAFLDRPRRLAKWSVPRFDFDGRFARGASSAQPCITQCALLEDVMGDGRRRLVRGVRFHASSVSVLEVIDVSSLLAPDSEVRRSGASKLAPALELWSNGVFLDVAWDPVRRLLWVAATSIELPYYVPELAAWDTARCPGARDEPTLLLAVRPESAHGVIPPLVGDAEHPPVKAAWAFATRPPTAARDPRLGGDRPSPSTSVVMIEINAFTPSAEDEPNRLGTMHLTFTVVGASNVVSGSVPLDGDGLPVGGFRADRLPSGAVDTEGQGLVDRFQPAEEIVRIDLGAISQGRCEAERALHAFGDRDTALRAIDADWRISAARRAVTRRCVEAMTSNWRWLLNAAAQVVQHDDVVAAIGAPKRFEGSVDTPRSEVEFELDTASRWLDVAERIHAQRCPTHGDGTCRLEWYLENERALLLAAMGEWEECRASALRSIALHRTTIPGPDFALDHVLLAASLAGLGRRDEAEESLRTAEQLHRERTTFPPYPDSAEDLTQRVLVRVQEMLR